MMTNAYTIASILLIILLCLVVLTCGYCIYRIRLLQRTGSMTILLKPTKVIFSHSEKGNANQLRTVVAYQNPFTGDFCVRKSRVSPVGAAGRLPGSPDSGLSEEYEPLQLEGGAVGQCGPVAPDRVANTPQHSSMLVTMYPNENRLSKTWNWNYKEYQI